MLAILNVTYHGYDIVVAPKNIVRRGRRHQIKGLILIDWIVAVFYMGVVEIIMDEWGGMR